MPAVLACTWLCLVSGAGPKLLGVLHVVHLTDVHVQAAGQRTFDTDLEQVVAQDLRRLVEQLLCFWHTSHHVLPPALALRQAVAHCTSNA